MLLSLSHKFLFIANVKTASSAIEDALKKYAEIAICETRLGKHDTLSVVSKNFSWVRKYVRYEDFFVFGVIRDPVDWLLSLYNFHSKPDFDGQRSSTKEITFGEFLREGFVSRWQMNPQHLRFVDQHGRFQVSHLIDFSTLEIEFPRICHRVGIGERELSRINVSPTVLSRDDLVQAERDFINENYRADYDLINRCTGVL